MFRAARPDAPGGWVAAREPRRQRRRTRGGEPRLSDLRDSGSIEQDADVVMFIHSDDAFKPKDERTNIKKVIVAKHRNGATGEIELFFDSAKTTFVTLEKNGFDDYAQSGGSGGGQEDDF
jgi:replicative DNA helicase